MGGEYGRRFDVPAWTAPFIEILWQFSTACANVVVAHFVANEDIQRLFLGFESDVHI
jgi:hypothetical protein